MCSLSNVPSLDGYLATSTSLHHLLTLYTAMWTRCQLCAGEHVEESCVQPMVCRQKERIDARGGPTVSLAELPVPWQDCTFRQKSHLHSRPPPVLFFTGGKNVPGLTLHCYAERFLPGIGLPAPFLGQFGSSGSCRVVFLQLVNMIYTEVLQPRWCTLQVRVGPSLRGFAISDRDGRSVLVQSMHNPLGIEPNTSISVQGGKFFGNHFHPFLISTPRRLDEVFLSF